MIGETLYIRDGNRRRYTNDAGEKLCSPDPRYEFEPIVITGETRDSWTFERYGRLGRVNKKTGQLGGPAVGGAGESRRAYTAEQMEDALWDQEMRPEIVRAVQSASIATLRKIAALLFD